MTARQLIGVLALLIVTLATHAGMMDGLEAHSAAEAGMDDRTRGLMMYEFQVGSAQDEPRYGSEEMQRRAEMFDVGPEVDTGPPSFAIGLFRMTLDLYDSVALFAYENRGWLSVTAIDTTLLTLNGLSVAVMGFHYRHVPRNARRMMR